MWRPPVLLAVLVCLSAASLFGALLVGPFPISVLQVLDSVLYPQPGLVHDVIWRFRAPRAATAFACGGLLGVVAALLPRARWQGGRVPLFAFLLGGGLATAVDTLARLMGAWQ